MMTTQQPPQSTRGLWSLIAVQAQGAFSDNVFKQMLILGMVPLLWSGSNNQGIGNAIVGVVFVLPFLLFSVWAGFLADKFRKSNVILITKLAEIAVMSLGFLAFLTGNFYCALIVMGLMATQSSFFGPSKYSVIPELIPRNRLAWANGMLELTSFLAVILGTASAAAILQFIGPNRMHIGQLFLIGLAIAGAIIAWTIPKTPRTNPDRPVPLNFLPEFRKYIGIIAHNRNLTLTIAGIAFFNGLAVLVLLHVNIWGEHALGMAAIGGGWVRDGGQWVQAQAAWWQMGAGWLLVALSLGIGIGAGIAGKISHDRIEPGLIPLGALIMSVFALPMGFATPGLRLEMVACLFMMGMGGGFFSVPLYALLQSYPDDKDRGCIMAANNFFAFSAVLFSSLLLGAINHFIKPDANTIFLMISLATLAAAGIVLWLLPEAAVRFIGLILTRLIYRIHVRGLENIPKDGPLLLVCNHLSFVDALLLQTAVPRPVRFIAHANLFETRISWLMKITRCIPIDSEMKPRKLVKSLQTAGDALANGEAICIFAEGQISRTGTLLPFRRGFESILKRGEAPVVPVHMEGVWGSIFSFERGRFFRKMPKRIPYPIWMAFGPAMPSTVSRHELRQAILDMGALNALRTAGHTPTLSRGFIRNARRYWNTFHMVDTLRNEDLTLGGSLTRTIVLARRLAPEMRDRKYIGVLLPPSSGGALVNYAIGLSGRTAVNLNFTAGDAAMESCIRQCELDFVITSKLFLKRMKIELPVRAVYLEDIVQMKQGAALKLEFIASWLAARCLPARWIERLCGAQQHATHDSLAAVIFSSGSTGEPKGVMLSHFNIAANVRSFLQAIQLWPHDRILGTLPFFHSFGYTVSLWGSAIAPFGVVYHPNPLDLKTLETLIPERKISAVITTPTFLSYYHRKLAPEVFKHTQAVITGAEKLPDSLREAFKEKFGIEPLQGYGCTECAPVVSVNVDDFRQPGLVQLCHKPGSVGKPLPGVTVRAIDPDTGDWLPIDRPGLLVVKGPNIMRGYLGQPAKTAEVIRDGWYNTGDIGYMDEDGFVFITDRLSRFSKIGGEMVPHVSIEEKMLELLGVEDKALVVTGIPDEKKGEVLVVLHTLDEAQIEGLADRMKTGSGFPNLWIPAQRNFFHIDELPVLGTGKLDLRGIRAMAEEKLAALAS